MNADDAAARAAAAWERAAVKPARYKAVYMAVCAAEAKMETVREALRRLAAKQPAPAADAPKASPRQVDDDGSAMNKDPAS